MSSVGCPDAATIIRAVSSPLIRINPSGLGVRPSTLYIRFFYECVVCLRLHSSDRVDYVRVRLIDRLQCCFLPFCLLQFLILGHYPILRGTRREQESPK